MPTYFHQLQHLSILGTTTVWHFQETHPVYPDCAASDIFEATSVIPVVKRKADYNDYDDKSFQL